MSAVSVARRAAIAAVTMLAVAACAPALPRDRESIARDLGDRTGHGLRADGGDRRFVVPPRIALGDGITADEAVAVALWNNAAFQVELARLGIARADLADAGALPNPVLSLLFPVGAKQLEGGLKWGLGWLWQRPFRVAAARRDAERVADELVQSGLDLARDTALAHAELLLARERRELARSALATWTGLLAAADARLRAGDASELEVVVVRADAHAAEVAVSSAEVDETAAQVRLRALLGAPARLRITIDPAPPVAIDAGLATWLDRARATRPDLRAATRAIAAASERAGLERARIVDLVGVLDANKPDSGLEVGPGIELTLPVFDWRQGGRIRARAELEQAAWRYIDVSRRIEREVIEAHARVTRAQQALADWETRIVPARLRALELAHRAYEAGEESFVVALEAARSLNDARQQRAELDAVRRRAAAELVRAVGGGGRGAR